MRALLLLVLASCTHDITAFDRVDVRPARDLDILYVFDNSPDRGNYDPMASQLDVLQRRLSDVDGQLPSLHVGVVTTDLGVRGRRDAIAGPAVGNCVGDGDAGRLATFAAGVPGSGYLEDLRGPGGTRLRNYESEDLAGELRQLTDPELGTANTGCEFEQPLEAMRRALDPHNNPDFLRPGAMLSVVFLTTEDDCSFARGALLDPNDATLGPPFSFRCTEQGVVCDPDDPRRPGRRANCRPREGSPLMLDVSEYRTFLTGLKRDPRDVVVSAVAGPRSSFEVLDVGVPALAPSCQGAGGRAMPAVRLGALVDAFGGALVDGCSQDAAYQQITAPIVDRQRSCLPDLRGADAVDCSVVETAGGARTELARCGDRNATPCWYSYQDAAACPAADHLGVGIRRSAAAPAGARVEATCSAN
jgi:hypothetical protein